MAVLLTLQADYADWLKTLPEGPHDSPMGQALNSVVNIDLDGLAEIDPPQDYGRD